MIYSRFHRVIMIFITANLKGHITYVFFTYDICTSKYFMFIVRYSFKSTYVSNCCTKKEKGVAFIVVFVVFEPKIIVSVPFQTFCQIEWS